MQGKFNLILIIIFLAGIFSSQLYATHLRAGEIVAERVNCLSLTYKITLTVYTNTGSSVLFGGSVGDDVYLEFGDDNSIRVPETANTLRPDLGENIGTASFTTYYTYGGAGTYLIRYSEPNRNGGVLNLDNSIATRFYVETLVNIDPFKGCNNTPKLLVPPIDRACPGVSFFHNPGAFDPDGDSLSYELVVPFSDRFLSVVNYRAPNTASFYTNFPIANEKGDGPPTFKMDPITGTLVWDSPGALGEYNIAFVVKEWRKIKGNWYEIGFVRRDMQIIVEDCDNNRPDLLIPKDTCIEAGTFLEAIIIGLDPEKEDVKIEAYSEIFHLATSQSPAILDPTPAIFQSSDPRAELHFKWQTNCAHIKDQDYQVVFKITDQPINGPKLVTFKTWRIRVVAPAPRWIQAGLDLSSRSSQLEWESYACSKAKKIQIWRRVDQFEYTPLLCETGMPPFMGYSLIDEVPLFDINNQPIKTYIDTNLGKGLAPGARYCYRLVAVFELPKGGESYISEEICVGPIVADAPVITNVTVDKTAYMDGAITIRWLAPFEADPVQFPPPYQYQVLRGVGYTGFQTIAHPGMLIDTFFVDTPIHTDIEPYNYRIICYDNNGVVVDTSAVASSVWIEAEPQQDKIEISWNAFVPWSNRQLNYPRHLIYRSMVGSSESGMQLIDSVDVNANGFRYVDVGLFNGAGLDKDATYCYRVMTRGGYGNPQIIEPLVNFSQILCTPLDDNEPPCAPSPPTSQDSPTCNDFEDATAYSCNQNIFSNQINWYRLKDKTCGNDVVSYNIYASAVRGGEFTLQKNNVRDTFYIDQNLPSYARCYKISAVDRSGNESELSQSICIDNCPYYELPNVFTPNGDGCNDTFSAYHETPAGGENEEVECPISEQNQQRCARFVRNVHLLVYNRWGKEVYQYQSGSENTIYIDWDGRSDNGKELSTGVYYYIAEVELETVEPSKRHKIIKGWVHLLR